MAKTKITQTPQGWIDDDDPTVFHPNRRAARVARYRALVAKGKTAHLRSKPSTSANTYKIATPLAPNVTGITNLSSLQNRLMDRLTQRQGVALADAMSVITGHGYNAAASYGHMREAGANHNEALIVIDLGSPDVSVAYGRARATGYNHTYALQKALRDGSGDD